MIWLHCVGMFVKVAGDLALALITLCSSGLTVSGTGIVRLEITRNFESSGYDPTDNDTNARAAPSLAQFASTTGFGSKRTLLTLA